MGEKNKKGQPNFMIVDKDTHRQDIANAFTSMVQREDIGIILICQNVSIFMTLDCKWNKGSDNGT